MKWLLLGLSICAGLAVADYVNQPPDRDDIVEAWLDSQRQGRPGYEFWASQENRTELYAVRDWEIVQSHGSRDNGSTVVRVDSSNKGGQPITVLWRIMVQGGKIISVREA